MLFLCLPRKRPAGKFRSVGLQKGLLLLLPAGQTIVGKVVSINIAILSLKFKSHKHLISVVLFDSAFNNLHMESC